jgi:cellulose biosynthesis protein BcsQ
MNGKVIAIGNRKGGVGKTTLTVALAHTIHAQIKKTVLVIDTDPQASASRALAGDKIYLKIEHLYLERLLFEHHSPLRNNRAERKRWARDAISPLTDDNAATCSLVPISPEFWRRERRLQRLSAPSIVGAATVRKRFARLLDWARRDFDITIIDTAPGVSLLYDQVLKNCDLMVIPCIPDRISIDGLSLLKREFDDDKIDTKKVRVAWTMMVSQADWRRTLAEQKDGNPAKFPFPGFEAPEYEGQPPEPLGLPRLVGIPTAITSDEPQTWATRYKAAGAVQIQRITEEVLKALP